MKLNKIQEQIKAVLVEKLQDFWCARTRREIARKLRDAVEMSGRIELSRFGLDKDLLQKVSGVLVQIEEPSDRIVAILANEVYEGT
jgi:hypothetical protein